MTDKTRPHTMLNVSKHVLLFCARGFEDLEAAAIIDVCGWTEYREHIPTVKVVTTGFHERVRGRFGLVITPDVLIEDVQSDQYDALALPGGFHAWGFDEAYDPRVHSLARAIHTAGGTIATMCVGILPIAEAGLLKGKKATTYPYSRNHDNPGFLRRHGCTPTRGPIEMADRIISSTGPAQAVEVSLLMLEALIGVDAVGEIKRFMAHPT